MITEFLAGLDRSLRGPARVRRRLLRDAADGLADTVTAYRDAGLSESAAASRALADFGGVAQLAPAFQAELDVAQARRTAMVAVLSTPPLVLLWNVLWDLGPDYDRHHPMATLGIVIAGGVVAGAAFFGLLAILASTGRLGARLSSCSAITRVRPIALTHAGAVALTLAMVPVVNVQMILWPPTGLLAMLTAAAVLTVARTALRSAPA